MSKTTRPTPDFAPFVLRGETIQAAQISALWFADGAPKLPKEVKIKKALRRVAIGLGEFEVSAGHGDWLILTSESTPVLMSDRDFRMLFRPAPESLPGGTGVSPVEPSDLVLRLEQLRDEQRSTGETMGPDAAEYVIDCAMRRIIELEQQALLSPPDSPLATRDLAPSPEATP